MKKKIVIEYEVEDKFGCGFAPDSSIKQQLKEIYEKAIKEEGCSEVKIKISTID